MRASSPAAVLGTGPGGLAIAADLATHGRDLVLTDVPPFLDHLDAVAEAGAVTVNGGWFGKRVVPVRVARSLGDAVADALLVVVSVRALAHRRFVEEFTPRLRRGASMLFMGKGGGTMGARDLLQSRGSAAVLLAETNACGPSPRRSRREPR